MAEPLSLTASIITLAGLVKIAIAGIERIRNLKNAPALILLVSQEVYHFIHTSKDSLPFTWDFSQISELGTLLQVAEQAAISLNITENHLAYGLLRMLDNVKEVIQELLSFVRDDLLKEPDSFDNEAKPMEVRWHVWLRKEGKIRAMAATLSDSRHKIATALAAMTAISVFVRTPPKDGRVGLIWQKDGHTSSEPQPAVCRSEQPAALRFIPDFRS